MNINKKIVYAFLLGSFSVVAADISQVKNDLFESEIISFSAKGTLYEQAKQIATDIVKGIQIDGLNLELQEEIVSHKPELYLSVSYGLVNPFRSGKVILSSPFSNMLTIGRTTMPYINYAKEELEKIIFESSGIIPGKNRVNASMQILAYVHRKLADYGMEGREFFMDLTCYSDNTKRVDIKQFRYGKNDLSFGALYFDLNKNIVEFVYNNKRTFSYSINTENEEIYIEAVENAQPMSFGEFRLILNDYLVSSMAQKFDLEIKRNNPPIPDSLPKAEANDAIPQSVNDGNSSSFFKFLSFLPSFYTGK